MWHNNNQQEGIKNVLIGHGNDTIFVFYYLNDYIDGNEIG